MIWSYGSADGMPVRRLEIDIGDWKRPKLDVQIGDLVKLTLYRSLKGHLMVASPEWLRVPGSPDAHNSLPRTRIVSGLVVDARRIKAPGSGGALDPETGKFRKLEIPLIEVLVGEEKVRVPIACVMEVMRRGEE